MSTTEPTVPEVIHVQASAISITTLLFQMLNLLLLAGLIYLCVLLVKALRKYLKSGPVRKENAAVRKSLGQLLKEYREQNHMTQEFVAEHLGVSRQAVSKWETGTSDPSTSNLLSLAKLYNIEPKELLHQLSQKP